MAAWIDKLKLSKPSKRKMDELYDKVLQAFNALDPAVRGEDLPRLAIEWGLPVKLAAAMENNVLIKIVAAAAAVAK